MSINTRVLEPSLLAHLQPRTILAQIKAQSAPLLIRNGSQILNSCSYPRIEKEVAVKEGKQVIIQHHAPQHLQAVSLRVWNSARIVLS